MIEHLFGSRTRIKLLRLFLTSPEKSFYVREITRLVNERINSVRRELANLEGIRLIVPTGVRQKKYFKTNQDCLLFPELKALILKEQVTVEQKFAQDLVAIGSIKYMVFTGKFTGVKDAPTDILIVGKTNRNKLKALVRRFEKEFNKDINYTVMTGQEFVYRRNLTDRFLYDILENKKIVMIDKL